MSEWLADYGMFLAQSITLAIVVGVLMVVILRARGKQERSRLHIEELNGRYRSRERHLRLAGMAKKHRKAAAKAFRRDDKQAARQQDKTAPRVWVVDFQGDIKATGTSHLAEEVSALLGVVEGGDEVVIRLESPGGFVHSYGLAAAQLDRLREAGVTTTVCIDKVAASGGYLMACGADQLRAAPFAVIGSIGVVAQIPNVHRLLKKHDIDIELLTAGRYKRTLTVLGENTQEGREKFKQDLENTHTLFKRHVSARRPQLDIDALATGEIWYGSEALEKGLIDAIGTSEAYLWERMTKAKVLSVKIEKRRSFSERMGLAVSAGVERGAQRLYEALEASDWQRR